MRRKTLFLTFALFTSTLFAQNNAGQSTISIGDEVPNLKFSKMVNYPAKEIALHELKDKLIILDFWAKW